nr:MAG TPA: carbohydrate-binding protein [Caudoviricetes sp.]
MEKAESGRKNVGILGGARGRRANAPAAYGDRRKQYLSDPTKGFMKAYGKYASDFVKCRMQGLRADDFYAWSEQSIRLADTIKQGTSLTRKTDDQKEFLVVDAAIDYVPEGAKVKTMGSTWLVTNPANLSGVTASGIMRRCNAVWRFLDWYGNRMEEPILVEKQQMSATANDFQELGLVMQGYFNITCQKNAQTDQLDHNSRIILGRKAFQLTGYSDVTQEFTGDDESTHLLGFTARIQEPNAEIDDMENRIAGGNNFSWTVLISGQPSMTISDTAQFTARSKRCGEDVESTKERPVSYIWRSSDQTVASVDSEGNVTAISAGTCRITAALVQNMEYGAAFDLRVEETTSEVTEVKFLSDVPRYMSAYDECEIEAAYFIGGAKQDNTVRWEFDGAASDAYTAETDGSRATIRCWGGAINPLRVTAVCEGESVSADIYLEGM